ncbi:methyltransferase [Vulcanisaeta distributa]|uniref:Methyltransferase small n=1 Tax=Vulcanisaeta distributa (strain DSM 14429 / JCM 11212 / NBRC 100878 / IC-017) TaxID=572478 RepID=E1QP41_VULDI|nr:methyltransferase [Vulcanisaeta distributa]ADN50212.1 methyltransferase small [Vulcanisaeta distributa DSM 14429]
MRIKVLSNIYPPAEDSWQTAELLRWVVSNYIGNKALRIIDVGSGTGILTLAALEEVVSRGGTAWVLSIDHDINASVSTRMNLVDNGLYQYADVVTANLLDPVKAEFHVDIIVSNPPYLPGNWHEDWRIFGGPHGIEITVQIIHWVCRDGASIVILTQSSLSNWDEVVHYMGMCGFKLTIIKATHYFFEDIITMVFERTV